MVAFGVITILAILFYMDTFIWSTKVVTIYKDGTSNKTLFQRRLIELSDSFWPFWLSLPSKVRIWYLMLMFKITWVGYIMSK